MHGSWISTTTPARSTPCFAMPFSSPRSPDPFRTDEYFLLFLTRLVYGDMNITVDRTSVRREPVSDYVKYDFVFKFRNGRVTSVPAP